jgi:hypothetical protein
MDRRLEVLAVTKHDLGAVQSESFDAETNLARARLREREFVKLKDFGGPSLMEANDLYGVGHVYPQLQIFHLDDHERIRTQLLRRADLYLRPQA